MKMSYISNIINMSINIIKTYNLYNLYYDYK